MSTARFIPSLPAPLGGNTVSHSYLSEWVGCRRKWFYRYLMPAPDLLAQGITELLGIAPRHTRPTLIKGSTFHVLMEWLLRSGCKDGEDTGQWDLERALSAAEASHLLRKPEYSEEERWAEDWVAIREMGLQYYETYGPGGKAPDYPNLKVVCDGNGEPVVERGYTLGLGYNNYLFTCGIDAIVEHLGYLKVMEHKTSAASWVSRRLRSAAMDSQFTGELLTLHTHFPDEKLYGVLLNVMVKGRSPNSKYGVAERDTINRTPADLEQFRAETIAILKQIDECVERFHTRLSSGMDWQRAAEDLFLEDGRRNDRCFAFNDDCEYLDLCKFKGMEHQFLHSYRTRTPTETKLDKEFSP